MQLEAALVTVGAFVLSAILTGAVRRFALSYGVIDLPNERSSHKVPTPRGGGLAIVLTTGAMLIVLGVSGQLPSSMVIALLGGGGCVALVGFIDDYRPLPAGVRLFVHFVAALWALAWLGGLPPLQIGDRLIAFGWFGYLLGAIGIVWTLNLFNFMDGIDGIAASEATFIAWGGALLAIVCGGGTGVAIVGSLFGAACCGFLVWNWPPARVFMGDVGSGYLGYFIAVLAIGAARENPVALLAWLILGGAFFVDSTVTFARRLVRGERVHEAHRSHAYQWLARRWESHRRVTFLVAAVNSLWLLPCAWLAVQLPAHAGLIALGALAPVCILAFIAGAGRPERPS